MNTQSKRFWPAALLLALVLALVPLTAYAAPGDEYEVVGAGSTAVNGVYTWVADGKYTFVNGATTYFLCNDNAASPTVWSIADNEMLCSFGGGILCE